MSWSIVYGLMKSLESHINNVWLGDTYEWDGTQLQTASCPAELEEMLTYTDQNDVSRIFGPSLVKLGRLQDDPSNLAKHLDVPSAYIEIAANDYEKTENWRHTLTRTVDPSKSLGRDYPVMVGGEHGMTRRFILKMTIFFLESNQDIEEVSRLGHAACQFLESICTANWEMGSDWNWGLLDEDGNRVTDVFNEIPWSARAPITHTRVRGGPEDDYIFDIKLYIEVNCYRSA